MQNKRLRFDVYSNFLSVLIVFEKKIRKDRVLGTVVAKKRE